MAEIPKERPLKELRKEQKTQGETTKTKNHIISQFNLLISSGGLSSKVVDSFPYPIVIFTPKYTLTMVNKAFIKEAEICPADPGNRVNRLLQYKIEDTQLAAAVTKIFEGESFFLENIKNPFSMFSEIMQQNAQPPGRFNKAVIFPVAAHNTAITHGVIVFMP